MQCNLRYSYMGPILISFQMTKWSEGYNGREIRARRELYALVALHSPCRALVDHLAAGGNGMDAEAREATEERAVVFRRFREAAL